MAAVSQMSSSFNHADTLSEVVPRSNTPKPSLLNNGRLAPAQMPKKSMFKKHAKCEEDIVSEASILSRPKTALQPIE